MSIIAIANQKGGCGKTTTSVNLSSAIALSSKKVLLIDLDPQSHATLGLNISSQNSIYNVLSNYTSEKLSLKDVIVNVETNFDVAPANILLGTPEQELSDEIGRELKLTEAIETVEKDYDYVLIDCPPNLGILTVNAIRAAQEVIIPVEPSRFSLIGVDRLVEIIDLISTRLNHPVKYRLLITMFDSRLRHSFQILNAIKEKYSANLFKTIIHTNVKLKEASMSGQSAVTYAKYSRGSKDYFYLASELMYRKEASIDNLMRQLVREKVKQLSEITFSLHDPNAQDVYLVGDFNNWKASEENRLTRDDNGSWIKRLALRSGTYHYKFVVDGEWQEDPSNPNKEENNFGGYNSLIEI
ncbi:MAG: AAA family ATPase [Candidatus Omnitrophica bacterium]|nr:AAA family ATPase [Candidatus Omnitrophota bacterium]